MKQKTGLLPSKVTAYLNILLISNYKKILKTVFTSVYILFTISTAITARPCVRLNYIK